MSRTRIVAAVEPVVRAGTSWQARALSLGLRVGLKPWLHAWSYTPRTIWPSHTLELLARHLPVPDGTSRRPVRLDDCDAEWISPSGDDGTRAVLYLHGGAFLCCGLNTHRRLVARVGDAADAGVLNVGYRLMPDHTINDAVADALAGYQWLLDQGYRGEDVVVAGDSAGGYLAFTVALQALEHGLPRPAGVVAMSPLTDLDMTGKRAHANAGRCSVFTVRAVEALADLADRVDARALAGPDTPPRVAPVDADLGGLPPTLVQVGSDEVLLADAQLMAARLAAAGVPCELQVWEGQVHVFQAASFVPEAHRAVSEVGDFVRAAHGRAARHEATA